MFISTKPTAHNSCPSCPSQVIWYTNRRCGASVDSAGSSSHAEPALNATRKQLMSAVPPTCSWPAQLISATSQCPGSDGCSPPMASQPSGSFPTPMTTWSWHWSLRRTQAKSLPTSQPSPWKDESCCPRLRSETWNTKGWSSSSLVEESGFLTWESLGMWPCVHQCNVVDIKCHKQISLWYFLIFLYEHAVVILSTACIHVPMATRHRKQHLCVVMAKEMSNVKQNTKCSYAASYIDSSQNLYACCVVFKCGPRSFLSNSVEKQCC